MSVSHFFRLGMWNPAGARTKTFKTREEREAYKAEASRTGYICWEQGEGHVDPR